MSLDKLKEGLRQPIKQGTTQKESPFNREAIGEYLTERGIQEPYRFSHLTALYVLRKVNQKKNKITKLTKTLLNKTQWGFSFLLLRG